MKRLAIFALMLASTVCAQTLGPNASSWVVGRFEAYNFGLWNLSLYQAPAGTGSQTFSLTNATITTPDGRKVMPFNTNASVYVGTEKVTITAIGANCIAGNSTPGACVLTASFSNLHTTSDTVRSATFGLQEALNYAGAQSGGTVTVDAAWANVGGTTAILNAATLPSGTTTEDCRTGCPAGGSGTFNALTGDATSTATGGATTVVGLNGTLLSGLATGMMKVTTATGAVSSVAVTGSGNVVLATSPTLVTPALGTPASGTLTNATGLPIASGVSGLGTGIATFLGTPSSANLASALTDETGSGAAVFATSPTLVTPALGTPASGVITNLTGTCAGCTSNGVTTISSTQACVPGSFTAQTDGATVTWAAASALCANASLTFTVHGGSRTLNLTGLATGGSYVIKLIQDATGGENLTGGTGCTWKQKGGGGSTFTLTATAAAIDILAFTYDGTNCYANIGLAYN